MHIDKFDYYQKRSAFISIALLLAVTLLLYGQVINHEFHFWDTEGYIHHNPHVLAGLTKDGVGWAFSSLYFFNWHPLTWLSHMLDVELFGVDPRAHHAINLLFHTINAVLLLLFLRRVTDAVWPPLIVAMLFAVHPLHVESVAWVAQRKDLLSLLLMLIALHAYTSYVQLGSRWAYAAALLATLLGLMSKPMLVTLPFVLLLLDYWPLRRLEPGRICWLLIEKLPFLMLSGLSIGITYYAQRVGGAMEFGQTTPIDARLGNAVVAYGYYLKQALIPSGLAVFYPHPGYWPWVTIAVNGILLTATVVVALLSVKRRPWIFVGLAIFVGMLVPAIGLVQVGLQAYADKYTYIPYIGLFIALVYGLAEWTARHSVSRVFVSSVISLLIIMYAGSAFLYLQSWRSNLSLWQHTLIQTDPYYRHLIGLSEPIPRPAGRLPTLYMSYRNYSLVLIQRGLYKEALLHLNEAEMLWPGLPETNFLSGLANFHLGHYSIAQTYFDSVKQMAVNDNWDNSMILENITDFEQKMASRTLAEKPGTNRPPPN